MLKPSLFTTLLLLNLTLVSCATPQAKFNEINIELNNKPLVANLLVDNPLENYVIVAKITGNTYKQTSIVVSNKEGKIYSYFIEPGNVELNINTDWYDKDCIIKVMGVEGNQGKLNILYKFY